MLKLSKNRSTKNFYWANNFNEKDWDIVDQKTFHDSIEKWETKQNLLSGKEFKQRVNTPACCDPSTETYHSM